jgi:hypothetical protein
MFLSGKNINRLKYELKEFYGEPYYEYIDDNIFHEMKTWYTTQPLDDGGIGSLYKKNQSFKQMFNPRWEDTKKMLTESSLKFKSVDQMYNDIMLGDIPVSKYMGNDAAENMRHDIFRGKTRAKKHKIDRVILRPTSYRGCVCIDCDSEYCDGCDTDVKYSTPNRIKYTLGSLNQTTGNTPTELSIVNRVHMVPSTKPPNRDREFARRLEESLYY